MSAWITLQTHALIGRTREQEIIRTALQADGLRVIFFIGEAGIGKTRLFNEIPDIFRNEQVTFAEMIDLYHTDFHTISGIENAIMNSLDPEKKAFQEYREKRKRYEQWCKKGALSQDLETLHAELGPQFVGDLNEWCRQNRRVVLCLDTVELVQSEQEIHPLLAGTDEVSEVRGWLVKRIPELNNAVVLLAGRPEGVLWQELQGALGGAIEIEPDAELPDGWQTARLISVRLGPLQEGDVPAYFAALAKGNERIQQAELTEDHYQAIYRVTRGRPLHLAFVATLLTSGALLPDALTNLDQGTDELNRQKMLEAVRNLSRNIYAALPFVGWLRKGVNGVLLSEVMTACLGKEWTPRRTRSVLAELRRLPFVKTRGQLVFLHDEMYDLLDDYVLNQDTQAEEKEKTCKKAIAWYDSRINQIKEAKRRQQLEVEQLYYRLLQNPGKGFEHFQERSDEALIGREVGFEMAMRDEVLRFFLAKGRRNLVFDSQNSKVRLTPIGRRIARDMATRQVLRLLRKGKHKEANELAKKLEESNQSPFELDSGHLFPCILLTYRGEALAYLGETNEAIQRLKEAIDSLKELEQAESRRGRIARMIEGLAYKNLGYSYARNRNYDEAARCYFAALKLLDELAKSGMRAAQLDAAHTRRNLAFVYGEQGRLADARQMCDMALDAFRALNNLYGQALTENVYGGIEYRAYHLHRSLARCKEALRLFTQIDDRRGIGLSNLWAGRASRKLSVAHTYEHRSESQKFLQDAQKHLERAHEIFEKEIKEPARLAETIAEEGKLNRDWAVMLRREKDVEQATQHEQMAVQLLEQAISEAKELGLIVESTDYRQDLATLYIQQGEYEKAEQQLNQAEMAVNPGCVLSPDQSVKDLNCPLPAWWEVMTKICASRGHIEWVRQKEKEAVEHWTLAMGYHYLFTPDSPHFREELAQSIRTRLRTKSSKELEELFEHAQQVVNRHQFENNHLLVVLKSRIDRVKQEESISV